MGGLISLPVMWISLLVGCNQELRGLFMLCMSALYDDHSNDGWGFLLMDAANAFNSVNRAAALWNAQVLWPSCSHFCLTPTGPGMSFSVAEDL